MSGPQRLEPSPTWWFWATWIPGPGFLVAFSFARNDPFFLAWPCVLFVPHFLSVAVFTELAFTDGAHKRWLEYRLFAVYLVGAFLYFVGVLLAALTSCDSIEPCLLPVTWGLVTVAAAIPLLLLRRTLRAWWNRPSPDRGTP